MTETTRTPLFSAQHAERYQRQQLIAHYQKITGATLIVMIDQIFAHGPTLLEELIINCDKTKPLHLLLSSPGGDGEVAVRLVRAMQARCSELTIIVPDMAKSAGTIMCLGANTILMAPASDLGPVDPQFPINGRLVGAKEIEQAVADAEARVEEHPAAYPVYAALLSDINMLMVEEARAARERSYTLIEEALKCSGISDPEIDVMAAQLKKPLIDEAKNHGATIGPAQAREIGLPVIDAETDSEAWQTIWSLWTRYFYLGIWASGGNRSVYEGVVASQVLVQ